MSNPAAMSRWTRVAALLAALVASSLLLPWFAGSAAASGHRTTTHHNGTHKASHKTRKAAGHKTHKKQKRVSDSKEAWYANSPLAATCTSPLGCLPATTDPTASAYPAGSLHVGVSLGSESSRSYVVPDLHALPKHTVATHGSLVLPVDATNGDGTTNLPAARIEACLVTAKVTDGVYGSTGTPPTTDCATHVKAHYDAKHQRFSINLSKFLKAWGSGLPDFGVALVPDTKGAAPTDTWQVTFAGRRHRHAISALLSYGPAPKVTQPSLGQPATTPGTSTGTGAAPQPATGPAPQAAPTAAAALPGAQTVTGGGQAPVVAGNPAKSQTAAPVALVRGFAYPMVFLLPLALLAGAIFLGRLFTREALPRVR